MTFMLAIYVVLSFSPSSHCVTSPFVSLYLKPLCYLSFFLFHSPSSHCVTSISSSVNLLQSIVLLVSLFVSLSFKHCVTSLSSSLILLLATVLLVSRFVSLVFKPLCYFSFVMKPFKMLYTNV